MGRFPAGQPLPRWTLARRGQGPARRLPHDAGGEGDLADGVQRPAAPAGARRRDQPPLRRDRTLGPACGAALSNFQDAGLPVSPVHPVPGPAGRPARRRVAPLPDAATIRTVPVRPVRPGRPTTWRGTTSASACSTTGCTRSPECRRGAARPRVRAVGTSSSKPTVPSTRATSMSRRIGGSAISPTRLSRNSMPRRARRRSGKRAFSGRRRARIAPMLLYVGEAADATASSAAKARRWRISSARPSKPSSGTPCPA